MQPIHPGEYLAEFLDEYGISQYRFAKDILYLHAGSTRSCMASVPSLRILHCGWGAFSTWSPVSGYIFVRQLDGLCII
jgi:hypothetical protein